ncbi:sulfate adenylyltransferase [Stratiformator vulcanicus]|uniref:Sulfate adenylyltransferase n=1 Tax=Stratiformator vulcanicus TaxID=2527980 RepID=A0A517R195_9PLAN|nr:sulfate adenylyltransferase [Stratiformator vulcanicus]QDT37658.1 Sulfate adenylyltransferase [Stratiformator vulcanicus]
MAALIPPHGGLTELINRTVADDKVDAFKSEAEGLTKVPVSAADLSTVYRIADGTLSPLTGPMGEAVYNRVLDESVIESNGELYAWTIPLSLPVTAELAGRIESGEKVALINSEEEIVGTLDVSDVFEWDKEKYLKSVYGTERTDHPGADMVLKNDAAMTHLLGGELQALPQPKNPAFGEYVLSPLETRAVVDANGYDAVVAFQTRNPLHRAHEYALVYGLEELLRDGKNAGAVLNPLIGETKGDDVSAEIRMETYEKLIADRAMGEGDSDPELWAKVGGGVPDRVMLLGLDIKMFYGGPTEAVMHAIYRQNFGYTHIVIGRKHADAPYADGTAIWGDFDAHEIFDNLNGDLKIQPVKVGFAAYYESMGRVDLMERHPDEKPVFISGKQVRATLQQGEMVDPRIMRESTSKILAEAMGN